MGRVSRARVAVLAGAAGLAAAVGVASQQLAAVARRSAERTAAALEAELEAALTTRRSELERAASRAAALPPLREALAGGVDVYTLLDLFESEEWWEPFRPFDVAVLRDGRVYATRGAGGDLVALARAAGASWGVVDGAVPRAAVVKLVDVPRARGRFALVLGRPLAAAPGAFVWRAGTHVTTVGSSSADAPRAPWADGVAFGSSGMRANLRERWVAVRAQPPGGGELWAVGSFSPGAPPSVAVPAFVVAGLLAMAALAFAWRGRRAKSLVPPTAEAPARWQSPALVAASPDLPRASSAAVTAIAPGGGQSFGRYTLIERVGEGGMSEIYSAVLDGAEGFQRLYVVKRLKPELATNKAAIEQFIDEAKLGSMLVHSNIVPVLDFGKIGDGYFLAEEYIVGRNLAEVVDRCVRDTGRPLPPPLACSVAHEVLEALAYAHAKTDDAGNPLHIVHRDVSPANVMATAQGEVKLLDFGIVKADQRTARTDSGNVKGNASFMSPEQARGQPVDARSDVFALGLVFYYLVSGEPLYPGSSTAEVFYRAATGPTADELARVRRLPSPLGDLVERALAIDRTARFPSARAFADALAPFVPGGKPKLAALMQALFGHELRPRPRTDQVAANRA